MAYSQSYLFIIFTLDGVLIGFLFDLFRILRKNFKTNDFITYIEDIIFWIIVGFIFIYSMYNYCNGELRLFMILGIIIGSLLYMVSLSKYIIKISCIIITILKKIIVFPIKIIFSILYKLSLNIYKVINKLILRPILYIYKNIQKNKNNLSKK